MRWRCDAVLKAVVWLLIQPCILGSLSTFLTLSEGCALQPHANAGSGSDCQPITSRDQSIGSFSSRSMSLDSPAPQSVIAYAQVRLVLVTPCFFLLPDLSMPDRQQ